MTKRVTLFCLLICVLQGTALLSQSKNTPGAVRLIVLGTVQDAGAPHIGCDRACCIPLKEEPNEKLMVVSLGLVDSLSNQNWLFEATPDLPRQLDWLKNNSPFSHSIIPDGIFLTHAHMGHYTGLMYLGREALGAQEAKVYAMPKMSEFLVQNGPWSQLVTLKNIDLQPLKRDLSIKLSDQVSITPFLVPHRDEYSETVGYLIKGPSKSALFIPDINKWSKWDKDILKEIKKVDYAFVDGTFYGPKEIGYRNLEEIPHPLVEESMALFQQLPAEEKDKVYFIHFNHTNPLLKPDSGAIEEVEKLGFHVAQFLDKFEL